MKKLLIVASIILFAVGCTTKKAADTPVLAKVGKTSITKEDFVKEINRLPEWARTRFQTEEGKKQFLEELIKKELVYQDALKKGLQRDEEAKEKIKEFEKMTLIGTMLKKEIEEKSKVDPNEVKDFYDKNPNKFMMGQQVRVKHILVDDEKQAKDIQQMIKKGENFSKLAEKYSKDKGSAKNGGDLGFFERGRMVPEFENAAFKLKVGEVSEPVKTRFGYHIIQMTDKKEGRFGKFEEVKDAIARQLATEKQRTFFDSYIETLKKNTNVETTAYEAELKALSLGAKQTPMLEEKQAPKE